MATQRKGCGFLITALILVLIGGGVATFLGMKAYSTGKEFVENIDDGTILITPNSVEITAEEDSEMTVWLADEASDSSDSTPSTETSEPLDKIVINITNTTTDETTIANKPNGSSNMNGQLLVGSFPVKKGNTYKIEANGLADGSTLAISSISSTTALSMVGNVMGAFFGGGAFAFLALIFGIIGLVKFFSSKEPTPPAI